MTLHKGSILRCLVRRQQLSQATSSVRGRPERPPTRAEAARPPAAGDRFISTPSVAHDLFGWGVIYALHARACIERGRVWQAEHYVGAVRDHALALACLRQGLPAGQARGYDDLPADTLARFDDAHVAAVEPDALRRALGASVRALMREGADARLPHAAMVAQRLVELR